MTSRLNKITTEEDIETFFGGPSWGFECHTKDTEEVVDNIIKVVNILIEAKLFSRYIEFSRKKTSDLDEESVTKFIHKNIEKNEIYINIRGDTTVYLPIDSYPGPKRSVNMRDIIRVHASYFGKRQSIIVFTTSSIWLPFNYKGLPQVDVYALNLNRLSSALVKIEALGLKIDDNSSYCRDERCIESGYLLQSFASDYGCHENYELEDYDIYGVSRTDW